MTRDPVGRLKGRRVLVVGDLLVDHFIWGTASRISPEAPVPVVETQRETFLLGGGGNVVNNLHELGGTPVLVGVVGDDPTGARLVGELRERRLDPEGVFVDRGRPTPLKTRVMAGHQQIARFDREVIRDLPGVLQARVAGYAEAVMRRCAAVLISDYGKGVVTRSVLSRVIRAARRAGLPVVVDPKVEHFQRYRGVTCLTPNQAEVCAGMRCVKVLDGAELIALGRRVSRRLNCRALLITRGEHGMTLFEGGGKVTHLPTVAREVYDVTGAGDTVAAVMALSLAAGLPPARAAVLANHAAGVVVGKLGTATCSPDELLASLRRAAA